MFRKTCFLFLLFLIFVSCNKTNTNIIKIENKSSNIITTESEAKNTAEVIIPSTNVVEQNVKFLWSSKKGEFIRTKIEEPYTEIYVYPDVENKIIENTTVQNGTDEELWYKIQTPNKSEGWLKYENQYICDEKNTNVIYNEVLSDYCIQNNFLVEGDAETGYKLYIGSPYYLLDISSIPEIKDFANQLTNLDSVYIYTKNNFTFDGSLFTGLCNLCIYAQHIDLCNIEKIWYLKLEQNKAGNFDFLTDCIELEELFIFSNENIILPDLKKLENLNTVSILSNKQKTFDGLETIPRTFTFIIKEKDNFFENLIMPDVNYNALINSNCNTITIENTCYQQYLKDTNFTSFIQNMENKPRFTLNIVE